MADLSLLTAELENLARRLREPDIDPVEASRLVHRAAELAAESAHELERQARNTEPPGGQTALL
jgi:hypothetical protein